MLLLIALFHLVKDGAQALPILAIDERTSQSCHDLGHCRTIWDIVWSCLITIFLCTWVAIHPNIPTPKESQLVVTSLRRLKVVGLALIAPELIILWAIRQRLVAHKLAKEHQNRKWTHVHGFFASMGGFMLFHGKQPLYPLTPAKIHSLVHGGYIDFPDITEDEIKDRSKGDVLSKGLVVLQTGWFLVQCIARGVERLAVTELEVMTVAFATFNLVMYVCWWDKPLNVQRPLRVVLKKPISVGKGKHRDKKKGIGEWVEWIFSATFGYEDGFVDLTTDSRVPTFHAGHLNINQSMLAALGAAAIAIIFGAIHCIAWLFSFPTHAEQTLWRVSSIVIVCVPAFYLVFFGIAFFFRVEDRKAYRVIFMTVIPTFLLLYVVARVVLLVQAFMTLRSLPPEAYQTVHWTTFIPHI